MANATAKQRREYRQARVDSYAKRGERQLAEMLVDLETSTDCEPEFLFSEWLAERATEVK